MSQLSQIARTATRGNAGGSARVMGRDCRLATPKIPQLPNAVNRQSAVNGGVSDAYPL